jgi:hypothetical protein
MIRRLVTLVVVAGLFLPLAGGCKNKTANPSIKDKPPPNPPKQQTPGGPPGAGSGRSGAAE